jgi:hypothetical protein
MEFSPPTAVVALPSPWSSPWHCWPCLSRRKHACALFHWPSSFSGWPSRAASAPKLQREASNRIAQASLTGSPVIASAHQRDFCEWLGLKVVAAFRAADTASIGEIEEAIDAGKLAQIKLVIANLPEGRRTADAPAERLKARVVVFENFPALRNGRVSFDEMLAANIEALRRAANP